MPRFLTSLFVFFALAGCTPGKHTPEPAPLVVGRPLLASLAAPLAAEITKIHISVRFPSVIPWQAELRRDSGWRVKRSDRPGTEDRADDALVAHFLETLESMVVEAEAGNGTDETFGFKPHRIEVRLETTATGRGTPTSHLLRFGDPIGGHSLSFRRENESRTWVTRGAWIALLPNLQSPSAFTLKNFWTGEYAKIRRVRLEKHFGIGKGAWEITRDPTQAVDDYVPWKQGRRNLSSAQIELVERILRQRIIDTPPGALALDPAPDPTQPDWTIRLEFKGTEPQTFLIFFPLNRVVGRSAIGTAAMVEFHPEFAGALRAFTQARFTPIKSLTK